MTEHAERVREVGVGELGLAMGIELDELSAERATARMPVEGNRQPLGLVNGGAYLVLGETLGFRIALAFQAAKAMTSPKAPPIIIAKRISFRMNM